MRVTQTLATCIVGDLVLPPSTSVVPSLPSLALDLTTATATDGLSSSNDDDDVNGELVIVVTVDG